MNTIILNNIDSVILEKLQVLSQRHNRTLEEEVTAIITEVAEVETVSFKAPRQVFRSKLEQARSQHGGCIPLRNKYSSAHRSVVRK